MHIICIHAIPCQPPYEHRIGHLTRANGIGAVSNSFTEHREMYIDRELSYDN